MSQENRKTLDVYAHNYDRYAKGYTLHDQLDPEKAAKKRAKLQELIKSSFADCPDGAKIVEIGTGLGDEARYLASLGYDVLATDGVDGFLSDLAADGIKTQKLNLLEDDFPYPVDGILCWRVFVHFTPSDLEIALKKCHDNLNPNGRFVFNLMNRDIRPVENEWVDFPGAYHMGVERFFQYYDSKEVFKLLDKIGFTTVKYFQQGGDDNNKWLVFVVKP